MIISASSWEQCSKCEGYGHYDYQCPFNFVPSDDFNDSKIVEDVHIPHEISSIIEDLLVNIGTPIIDESHVSSVITSDVDTLVNSSTLTHDEVYINEKNQESQETEVESTPIVYSSSQSLQFLAMIH